MSEHELDENFQKDISKEKWEIKDEQAGETKLQNTIDRFLNVHKSTKSCQPKAFLQLGLAPTYYDEVSLSTKQTIYQDSIELYHPEETSVLLSAGNVLKHIRQEDSHPKPEVKDIHDFGTNIVSF